MNFMQSVLAVLASVAALLGSFFTGSAHQLSALGASAPGTVSAQAPSGTDGAASSSVPAGPITASRDAAGPHVYTQAELLSMAGDTLADGNVPLGDGRYVTSGPKQGYIYLCTVRNDNPGSMVDGPWIHGSTWNFKEKVSVQGTVTWKDATFDDIVQGAYRILTGNDLPVGQTTGTFPIASSDAAYQYDRNPNSIKAQRIKFSLPASPTYSAPPHCMGMEVGVMTDGVTLFNGFDAGLRDAPAHELQDSNDGHPQGNDQYHYHSLPAWAHDASVSTVIGFAYDGFPITGPVVAPGKYLTTADLDECHGLTSAVNLGGTSVVTYHYVMTYDFPYSASCFRGTPVTTGPSVAGAGAPQSQSAGQPPAAAVSACSGKSSGASCSFSTPNGAVNGSCETPPGASLACVPAR